jgi:hypothetical protein
MSTAADASVPPLSAGTYAQEVPDDVAIESVELSAPQRVRRALHDFYAGSLGLASRAGGDGPDRYVIGPASLAFTPISDAGDPFYHFALLVPGNRFEPAKQWLSGAAPLLPDIEGRTTFAFDFWDAQAAYVLDPAGNIVEVIAHRGVADAEATGAFAASEVSGLSEIGLVTTRTDTAVDALARASLPLWSGASTGGELAFCGAKAHTAIVCPRGRGWLPTNRPAEIHPVNVRIRGQDGQPRKLALLRHGNITIS